MKKYLLGIFAVVAAISMSAFSTSHVSKKHNTAQQAYFWYPVSGNTITGPAFNSGGSAMTLDAAISANPLGCDNTHATDNCYVGELTDNFQGSQPSDPTDDNRLKKTN